MSRHLENQILTALRRALAEGRLDAAEHLLRALEVLCAGAAPDPRLDEAYLAGVGWQPGRLGPQDRRAHSLRGHVGISRHDGRRR